MERVYGEKVKMTSIVTNMKVNTCMIKNMVSANLLGNLEIFTKATISKTKETVTEKCILQMELFTRGSGLEVYREAKVK